MNWLFNNPCRRLAADLSLLAAGVLDDAEGSRVREHLEKCPACRARFAALNRLAGQLAADGQNLPPIEPPVSLRRRWMTAVNHDARTRKQPESLTLPAWLSGRHLGWGGVAAMWMLILFFRFSAPDAPRPAVVTAPPTSLRQILLALRTDLGEPSFSVPAEPRPAAKPSVPAAPPPHSERPEMPSTINPCLT